ncbi:MAG TPA: hypothetical protein VFK05_26795 [Polyangiaceae bacterium]|nr:hypothetical protein [Polyangiaceae bacterium]
MRALSNSLCALGLLVSTLGVTRALRAAEPSGERFPDAKPPLALLPTPEDALIDPRMARSWATLPPRTFVATTVDIGFVYLRPRLSLGYGRPFTSWIGVDANPIAMQNGLGVYAGLRLELPHLDLRVGPRYFSSFNHTYLPPQMSYSRLDLESNSGSPAHTLTYEAELDLNFDIGPGRLLLRGSASYVSGVPDGYNAFEETLHIIVEPPLVWRARLAYAYTFGARKQHGIGAAIDLLDVPKRDDSRTIRIGPVLRLALSRRVDVRGSFIFTVVSPDRIGLAGGDFTELGLRYRWASE